MTHCDFCNARMSANGVARLPVIRFEIGNTVLTTRTLGLEPQIGGPPFLVLNNIEIDACAACVLKSFKAAVALL